MTIAPVSSAGPEDDMPISGDVAGTCYEVNPYNMPPVAIYECPTGG